MKSLKLVDIVKNNKVYIQTHNYPDPDAIASAFGLQFFLKQHGIDAIICYDGKVEKLSTRKMFEVFDIVVMSKSELDMMRPEDKIIIVDAQKFNANITDFVGDEVACIDHHPTCYDCDYEYKDVRIVGACSSIVADYFYETDTPLAPNVAAALVYGIKMDTSDFIRGATPFDAKMFDFLFGKADKSMIAEMYSNVMEFDDLKAYGAAIDNVHINHEVGFAKIPFDCPDALIAIISDFILSLDVVTISVVYAIRNDGIKFSVRSELEEVDAGHLTRQALKDVGNGGGHKGMAGGFIPDENIPLLGKNQEETIEENFMNVLQTIQPDNFS